MGIFDFLKKKETSTVVTRPAEVSFWEWFIDNKKELETFIDSEQKDFKIYDELTKRIKTYNRILFAELTKNEAGKYIIIITPDGLKDGVLATKKLGESHPLIENWLIQKFRQPMDDIRLEIGGITYPPSDIEVYAEVDRLNELVNVEIFIRNMDKDEEKYQTIAWLYMDHIIGEFNSITKVGSVAFHNLKEGKSVENGISLVELRKLIEDELYLS